MTVQQECCLCGGPAVLAVYMRYPDGVRRSIGNIDHCDGSVYLLVASARSAAATGNVTEIEAIKP